MAWAKSDGRSSRAWKELSKVCRRDMAPICHLCGGYIDRTLPARHRRSWTLDHILPLNTHPHIHPHEMSNLAPAHWSCNSSKQDKTEFTPRHPMKKPKSSRAW